MRQVIVTALYYDDDPKPIEVVKRHFVRHDLKSADTTLTEVKVSIEEWLQNGKLPNGMQKTF